MPHGEGPAERAASTAGPVLCPSGSAASPDAALNRARSRVEPALFTHRTGPFPRRRPRSGPTARRPGRCGGPTEYPRATGDSGPLGCRAPGQPQREDTALARLARRVDRAAVGGDQMADDGQTEPGASGTAAAGLLRAPEPVEHVRQVLGRDARACVGDRQDDLVAVPVRGQRDRAAGRGVPQRVGDQVAERLPHPDGVGVQPQRVLGPGAQFHLGGDPVGRRHLLEQFVAAHGLAVQTQGAGVGGREVLEVVDDALEDERLLVQGGEQRRVGFDDAVPGDLQPAADVGERAAQFVGDVADHRLALGLKTLTAFGQVVEGGGEDAGLVPCRDGYPDVEFGRLLGRRGERPQGPYEPAGDQGGRGDGHGEHQRGGADDLGLVARGHVEEHGGGVPGAEEEFGTGCHVGVELGTAGLVDAGLGQAPLLVAQVAGQRIARVHPAQLATDRHGRRTAQSGLVQAVAGESLERPVRLLLRRGGGVEESVGAGVGHVVGGGTTVRVGEHRPPAGGQLEPGLQTVPGEAQLPLSGQGVDRDAFLLGKTVRAHGSRVDAGDLRAALAVGVGVQRVHGGGRARRQGRPARRRVGDDPAVGGGQGDAPAGPLGQAPHGGGHARPVGMGRRVPAEVGEDLHVVGERLTLLLAQGLGGGGHGQPGRRGHRGHGDEPGRDQQPHQQPLVQGYPDTRPPPAPGGHPRPPLSL